MKTKPIIFSAPMVRALLKGRKTQTRRVVKIMDQLADRTFTGDLVDYYGNGRLGMRVDGSTLVQPIPDAPGDLIWVRETFWVELDSSVVYRADGEFLDGWTQRGLRWCPSIFMPRWASRATLEVTDVRVQRIGDITKEDAFAEGLEPKPDKLTGIDYTVGKRFEALWDSINAKRGYGWAANPWVRALTFKVHQCNVDQLLRERV